MAAQQACANQQWKYEWRTGHIVGFDGRCLDVQDAKVKEGSSVIYWARATPNAKNQQWVWDVVDEKSGFGYFRCKSNIDLVMEVKNGPTHVKDGGELIIWTKSGQSHQLWSMDSNGVLRSAANPLICVDIEGGVTKAGSKVCLWTAKLPQA